MLPAIARAGWRVRVAAPAEGPLAEAVRARGVEVVPLDLRDGGTERMPLAAARERLAALIARQPPDLVHANSLSMGRLAGPVVAEARIASVAHLRDIVRLSQTAVVDLNRNDRLIAVSAATREYHVRAGLEAGRTVVVHNGVDLAEFAPRAATGYLHRELALPEGAPLVGTIGQLALRKGLDVWLEAARRVAAQHRDAQFLLVGERFSQKEESRQLEESLREAGCDGPLAGRLHLLGFRADVPRLLGELTLLVHAARQEPLGRVLLEGAAAGCPIVATGVGGTAEIFPPRSDAALLVPAGDAVALAEAIDGLLADPQRRAALATAARRRAEEAFAVERAGEGLLGVYGEVLEARGAG